MISEREAVTAPALTLTPPPNAKYWTGGHICDFCKRPIKGDLFDAVTVWKSWATMCLHCWRDNTNQQTGTGLGQHYKQTTEGRWLKVAG